MKDFLRSLDVYGGNVLIYHNSHRSIKSCFGGLITLFIMIVMTLVIVGLGGDFFYRTNPSFIKSELNPKEFPNVLLSNTNFMFALRYEDINAVTLDKLGQSFYFNVWRRQYFRNSLGEWEVKEISKIPYSQCKREKFTLPELYDEKNIKDFNCIDYDNEKDYLGGGWEANLVNYFLIDYSICFEGEFNPYNGLPCNPTKVTDDLISNYAYVSFYIQDLFVDPSDYENPISKAIFNFYHLVDKQLLKTTELYFNIVTVQSDYGWILESLKDVTEIKFNSKISDYNIKEGFNSGEKKSLMGNCFLYMRKTLEKYNRTYTKIQTLAANVGGIMKTITFLMSLIIQTYNYFDFKTEIINSFQLIEGKNKKNSLSQMMNDNVEKLRNLGKEFKTTQLKDNEARDSNTLNLNNNSQNQTNNLKNTPKISIMQNDAYLEIPKRIHKRIEEERINNNKQNYISDNVSSIKYILHNYICCICTNKVYKNNLNRLSLLLENNFSSKSIILNNLMTNKLYDIIFDNTQKKIILNEFEGF
jgi:hypothetical protein